MTALAVELPTTALPGLEYDDRGTYINGALRLPGVWAKVYGSGHDQVLQIQRAPSGELVSSVLVLPAAGKTKFLTSLLAAGVAQENLPPYMHIFELCAQAQQQAPAATTASDNGVPSAPSIHVLRKLFDGEELTLKEKAEYAAYEAHLQRVEEERSRIGMVDLGALMEEGVEPPEMLVEGYLVKGAHHVFHGKGNSLKTWCALACAVAVVHNGGTVLWVDLEMGRKDVTERLLALGADPEEISDRFVYLEYPTFSSSATDRTLWSALIERLKPDLVVWDAQTGALAAAELEENSGTAVGKWQRWYIEPVRQHGGTVLLIDHTAHHDDGRPVASRQKYTAAKVTLGFSVKENEQPNRDRVGFVTITCTKNNLAAPIPEKRRIRAGADPDTGRFVFGQAEETMAEAVEAAASDINLLQIRSDIERVVKEHGKLTQAQLAKFVRGTDSQVIKQAKELALDEMSRVGSRPVANRIEYFWRDEPAA